MRTTFFTTVIAIAVVVACADKNPSKPTGPGSGTDTTMTGSSTDTGSGSSMTTGSDSTMGSGSAMTGSGSAADTGSGSGSGSGSGAVATDDGKDAFISLPKDEKIKIMKTEVVPTMGKAFKEHGKKKFAKFGCKTCHGKGVADGSYKMPNPDLPKLDFAALEAGKQEPDMAEFMAKVVKPEMAKMLKLEEYSQDNPKGFGCLHCHLAKK